MLVNNLEVMLYVRNSIKNKNEKMYMNVMEMITIGIHYKETFIAESEMIILMNGIENYSNAVGILINKGYIENREGNLYFNKLENLFINASKFYSVMYENIISVF